MEKKKIAGMAVALSLAAIVGTGATLAYMSDQTETLTNTFTFTDKNIGIKLDEAKIDKNNQAVATDERVQAGSIQAYQNIEPNMLMDKDPTVTVAANSIRCNVFVSVKNENAEDILKIVDLDSNSWKKVDPATYELQAADSTTAYYLYVGAKATGTPEQGDQFSVIETTETDPVVLEDVFNKVQAGEEIGKNTVMKPIVIQAAAVQADSVTDVIAAKNALGKLGCR